MSVWAPLAGSEATEGLARQVRTREGAQSWLLLGPTGSGKKAAALAIAAALNCTTAPGEGCGDCSTCRRIMRQRHPDVHHVIPEGPIIPVDVIREVVVPEAARSPFEARGKVFVIEEAHRMNPAAQNALLKTLEEPHTDTVFVLISDQEEDVLETIRSRCLIVRLDPVSEERIVSLLVEEGAAHDLALLAARLSEGDLVRARSVAFGSDALERRRLWMLVPRALEGSTEALDLAIEIQEAIREVVHVREAKQKQEIAELADALGEVRGTAAARNALAKRHRRELRRLEEEILGEALTTIASFYRDVLATRWGGDEGLTNIDVLDEIGLWAESDVVDAALVAAFDRCTAARAALSKNANPSVALEATLLELSRLVPPPAGARVRA
jgi:DNA polymerase-3 subunit delta'